MPKGPRGEKRPADVIGAAVLVGRIATGEVEDTRDDPAKAHHREGGLKGRPVRQNLTMRMSMRRFTRLTNAFSKKLDNHMHALALYFVHYNFCRIHKSLRMSPAMAAGVSDRLWSLEDVIARMDAAAPAPAKRGPYKARISN